MPNTAHSAADAEFDGMLAASDVSDAMQAEPNAPRAADDDPDATSYVHNSVGRPSKLTPTIIAHARQYARHGATDREIASYLDINVITLNRWRHESEEFCSALVSGKEHANSRVERALYDRAVGYTFDSEKVFSYQGEIVRTPTVEHVPPDIGAITLWLKNRLPDQWRDKQDVNVSLSLMDLIADAIAPAIEQPAPIEGMARDVTEPE